MSFRPALRATLLATSLAFALACSGMLEAGTPEPPVPAPESADITSVNSQLYDGVGSVTTEYTTEDGPADVHSHYKDLLDGDGWEVNSARTGDGGTLTATKDDETFTVTISKGEFQTVWTTM